MKLKATKPNLKSMKLTVPHDGTVNVDAEGCIDVSAKCAKQLVELTPDWRYVDQPSKSDEPKGEEGKGAPAPDPGLKGQEVGKEGEGDEGNEGDEDETLTAEEYAAELNKSTVKELQAMAAEAEFPEEEVKAASKTKALLVAYLVSQAYNEDGTPKVEDDEDEQ